jgi:hypothetical protein
LLFPVSRAQVLATAAVALRIVRITALPGPSAAALQPQTGIDGKPIPDYCGERASGRTRLCRRVRRKLRLSGVSGKCSYFGRTRARV